MPPLPPRVRLFLSAADERAIAAWTRAARRDPGAAATRMALDEQRWLAAVMHEERRSTPLEEREAFDARCDRVLARLDPPAPSRPVVLGAPERARRPALGLEPRLPSKRRTGAQSPAVPAPASVG